MRNTISFFLVALASVCKALSDTLWHHYDTSIFRHLNPNFWNPLVSWQTAKVVFAYKLDAWHLSNSLMQLCWIAAILFYVPSVVIKIKSVPAWVINFLIFTAINIFVFNICYNSIFR